MPVIPAIGKLRKEEQEFEVCLGYIVRPCLKTKTIIATKQNNSPN
jgi:hypothetical protein